MSDAAGFMAFVIWAIVVLGFGAYLGIESQRDSAIKSGVAEYRLISPESDKTEFKWKEIK